MSGIKIEPDQWYLEDTLRLLGAPFDSETLARARRGGKLEAREPKRGQRIYKGEWLLAWLEAKEMVPA